MVHPIDPKYTFRKFDNLSTAPGVRKIFNKFRIRNPSYNDNRVAKCNNNFYNNNNKNNDNKSTEKSAIVTSGFILVLFAAMFF